MNNDKLRVAAPDSPLDRAIDRAVRDIMRVDPPAGLRRRVLARLEAPPRRSILFPRFTVAAAALALLVLTIFVMRPTTPPPADTRAASEPTPPPASPAATPRAAQPPAAASPAEVAAAPRESNRPRSERIRMPRVTNVFGGESGVAATNLREAPPAAATAVADERPADPAGALAPITILPLTIPGIAVEPLRIPTMAPPK